MPVSILRWKGGSGGDFVLYAKSLSNPGSVINVRYLDVDATGRTAPDFSKIDFLCLRNIDKIALREWIHSVDVRQLLAEVNSYETQPADLWIKSHYYDDYTLKDRTIDIVADAKSLPFVVASNLAKTRTLQQNFNFLVGKIPDATTKLHYVTYCVAKDSFMQNHPSTDRQIFVSELLSNLNTWQRAVSLVGITIDQRVAAAYHHWLGLNQQYMLSSAYLSRIKQQDYDWQDTQLTIIEKYCLMMLGGYKFQNLR